MTDRAAHLVTEFCNSLLLGDMVKTCSYLSPEVVYHNMPWGPVIGHAEVRKILDPLVHGPGNALRRMDISHTVSDGVIVMNARLETWVRGAVNIDLPVAGVFEVREGLITRWSDYFDAITVQPLMDTLKA